MYIFRKATLVLSLLLLFAAVSCVESGKDTDTGTGGDTTSAAVNSPFADLQVNTLEGQPKTFGDYMGKPLVINYFAMF